MSIIYNLDKKPHIKLSTRESRVINLTEIKSFSTISNNSPYYKIQSKPSKTLTNHMIPKIINESKTERIKSLKTEVKSTSHNNINSLSLQLGIKNNVDKTLNKAYIKDKYGDLQLYEKDKIEDQQKIVKTRTRERIKTFRTKMNEFINQEYKSKKKLIGKLSKDIFIAKNSWIHEDYKLNSELQRIENIRIKKTKQESENFIFINTHHEKSQSKFHSKKLKTIRLTNAFNYIDDNEKSIKKEKQELKMNKDTLHKKFLNLLIKSKHFNYKQYSKVKSLIRSKSSLNFKLEVMKNQSIVKSNNGSFYSRNISEEISNDQRNIKKIINNNVLLTGLNNEERIKNRLKSQFNTQKQREFMDIDKNIFINDEVDQCIKKVKNYNKKSDLKRHSISNIQNKAKNQKVINTINNTNNENMSENSIDSFNSVISDTVVKTLIENQALKLFGREIKYDDYNIKYKYRLNPIKNNKIEETNKNQINLKSIEKNVMRRTLPEVVSKSIFVKNSMLNIREHNKVYREESKTQYLSDKDKLKYKMFSKAFKK